MTRAAGTGRSGGARIGLEGLGATLLCAAAALVLAPSTFGLTWGAPKTISSSGELTQNDPSTAMDARGDAIVAWATYHSSNFDCPCRVRAAVRSAGGSFGTPVTVATSATGTDSLGDVHAAMDSSGDAIVVWDEGTPKSLGMITGEDHKVYAAVRPAGGSFGAPDVISVAGATADGGGAPQVAMDSAGDAVVAWVSGLGWFSDDPEPQLQVVKRPANGSFASPQAYFGSGSAGPWDFQLAMSPDGHAAVAFTDRAPSGCDPGGGTCDPNVDVDENVEVTTAAPGGSFGAPQTVSPTVTQPDSTQGPSVEATSVAIDDGADVIASYDQDGPGSIFNDTRRDEFVTSDSGGAFSSPLSLGASGRSFADQVAIGPTGESTATWIDSNGLRTASRPLGGSFGAQHLLAAAEVGDALASSSNATGANGSVLAGLLLDDSFNGTHEQVAAALRPAGGTFGTAAAIEQVPSGTFFDMSSLDASIDKSADSAVLAWAEYTGGNAFDPTPGAIRVALAANAAPKHTLTVSKSGTGSGTVTSSPAGINCGSTCSHAYTQGTAVTLTAHPATGSKFTGWSGSGCSGTATCKVTMSANHAVTATFAPIGPPNTTITGHTVSSANRSASFAFKGSGGVGALHFKCKLDTAAYASCTSPKSYSHLARGSHTFRVEAIDSRGKVDPTPASLAFKVAG